MAVTSKWYSKALPFYAPYQFMKKPKGRWTVRFIGSNVVLFTEIVRPTLTIYF
jgi:hypothetical protein